MEESDIIGIPWHSLPNVTPGNSMKPNFSQGFLMGFRFSHTFPNMSRGCLLCAFEMPIDKTWTNSPEPNMAKHEQNLLLKIFIKKFKNFNSSKKHTVTHL